MGRRLLYKSDETPDNTTAVVIDLENLGAGSTDKRASQYTDRVTMVIIMNATPAAGTFDASLGYEGETEIISATPTPLDATTGNKAQNIDVSGANELTITPAALSGGTTYHVSLYARNQGGEKP